MTITMTTWMTALQKALAPAGFRRAGTELVRKQEENWAAIWFERRRDSDPQNLLTYAGVRLTIDSVARFEGDHVRSRPRPRILGAQPKDFLDYDASWSLVSFVEELGGWPPILNLLVEASPAKGGELKFGRDFLWARGGLAEMVELVRGLVVSRVLPILDECTTDRKLLDYVLSGGRFGGGTPGAYNMAVLTRRFGPYEKFEEYAAKVQRMIDRREASPIGQADLDRLRRGDLVDPPLDREGS